MFWNNLKEETDITFLFRSDGSYLYFCQYLRQSLDKFKGNRRRISVALLNLRKSSPLFVSFSPDHWTIKIKVYHHFDTQIKGKGGHWVAERRGFWTFRLSHGPFSLIQISNDLLLLSQHFHRKPNQKLPISDSMGRKTPPPTLVELDFL